MVDKRKEEFKRSFEKYYPVLCNIAYRYLLDKETSEDIVQDTMLSVWQNKKDLLPESELVPYLKVSIRNNCISFLRKQTFEVLSIADELVSQKVCSLTEECEEEGVASSEKIEHLLGVLPTKCSLVFRMNKLHGMKYREIAEELNISEKTVENQMGKAIRLLRDYVASHPYTLILFLVLSDIILN